MSVRWKGAVVAELASWCVASLAIGYAWQAVARPVGGSKEAVPNAHPVPEARVMRRHVEGVSIDSIVARNPFGLGSDEEEPPGNTPPEARYPMSMPVRPAAAPLLVAIVGPPWRAVLRTGGGDQTVVVELGDTVGAYHVRGIARTGVSLRSGDSSLRLTLEPSR